MYNNLTKLYKIKVNKRQNFSTQIPQSVIENETLKWGQRYSYPLHEAAVNSTHFIKETGTKK